MEVVDEDMMRLEEDGSWKVEDDNESSSYKVEHYLELKMKKYFKDHFKRVNRGKGFQGEEDQELN